MVAIVFILSLLNYFAYTGFYMMGTLAVKRFKWTQIIPYIHPNKAKKHNHRNRKHKHLLYEKRISKTQQN